MITQGWLDRDTYDAIKDSTTETRLHTADVTQSLAPYFAEQVRQEVTQWGKENNIDVYGRSLGIETTLDSRMQSIAEEAATTTLNDLQAVVNCEWSAPANPYLRHRGDIKKYQEDDCHTDPANHWAHFWKTNAALLNNYVRESARYRSLLSEGKNEADALQELRENSTFMDSLKSAKSRLEVGLVAMNPANGHINVWVGGRDLATDWYDHVGVAQRQPGSTFKPFTYAWAVESGYSPETMYLDSVFQYLDEATGEIWSPQNFGDVSSGDSLTMREGLARSKNTISAQIIRIVLIPGLWLTSRTEWGSRVNWSRSPPSSWEPVMLPSWSL